MSNLYLVSTQGHAGSKIPPSIDDDAKDITIKKLNSIINHITSESLLLQTKYKDCQQELNVLKNKCSTVFNQLLKVESSEIGKGRGIETIAKQKDVPELLKDYLQVWGFTEYEAKVFCHEMGLKRTDQFKKLEAGDWLRGGDVYKFFEKDLSKLKKDYIWWLNRKLNGETSRLNADIIKEISSKWRKEVQTISSLGPSIAGTFSVI